MKQILLQYSQKKSHCRWMHSPFSPPISLRSILILFFIYAYVPQVASSLQIFRSETMCLHFLSPPHAYYMSMSSPPHTRFNRCVKSTDSKFLILKFSSPFWYFICLMFEYPHLYFVILMMMMMMMMIRRRTGCQKWEKTIN